MLTGGELHEDCMFVADGTDRAFEFLSSYAKRTPMRAGAITEEETISGSNGAFEVGVVDVSFYLPGRTVA